MLSCAVAADDRAAIRAWISRFGDCDGPGDDSRLMTEIIAEAGRNPRVADIYRAVDDRVRASLSAALAALVPDDTRPADLLYVVDLILALGTGILSRRVLSPTSYTDMIDRLVSAATERRFDMIAGR